MKPTLRSLTALLMAASATALGHAVLTSPAGRSATLIKAFPCGMNTAGTSRATYAPGQAVTVTWNETQGTAHPGYFILDFGRGIDGTFDGGFSPLFQPDGGALSNIANPAGSNTGLTAMVKIPADACPLCQLRLRQFMSEPGRAADPWYFSCADITISGGDVPDAGSGVLDSGTAVLDSGTPVEVDSGTVEPVVDSGTSQPQPMADSGTTTNPGGNNPGVSTNPGSAKSADAEPAEGCSAVSGSLLAGLGLVSLLSTRKKRRA